MIKALCICKFITYIIKGLIFIAIFALISFVTVKLFKTVKQFIDKKIRDFKLKNALTK